MQVEMRFCFSENPWWRALYAAAGAIQEIRYFMSFPKGYEGIYRLLRGQVTSVCVAHISLGSLCILVFFNIRLFHSSLGINTIFTYIC